MRGARSSTSKFGTDLRHARSCLRQLLRSARQCAFFYMNVLQAPRGEKDLSDAS